MNTLEFIKTLNWKVFFMTFAAMFIMVALQKLGVRVPAITQKITDFIRPVPPISKAFQEVKQKLDTKPNTFALTKPAHIVPQSYAAADYDSANAYVVLDYNTGNVLLSKNMDTPVYIASLTKLMSAVVSLDLAHENDVFTISNLATTAPPTKIGVVAGQKATLHEMLDAMLMTSANDAAQVVRDGVETEYKSPIFVDAMNEKARYLGLTNTHFDNPQGFDGSENHSSAHDLATLTHYALTNYALIDSIAENQYQRLPASQMHKQFDLYNWNGLLGVYPGAEGVKIGNTEKAGYTTIVLAQRNGKKILTVLLGADTLLHRDLWAAELLDKGFLTLDPTIAAANITESQLKAKYATWQYWN